MSVAAAVETVHRAAGAFALRDRAWIEVRGADRTRFLQGQLTNDVAKLDPAGPRAGCHALLLTREGRIVAELHVVARPEAFWLETDAASAPAAVERLSRYVVADDVVLTDRSAELARFSVEGPRAFELVGAASGVALALASEEVATIDVAGVSVVAAAWGFGGDPAVQLFAAREGEAAISAALQRAARPLGAICADADVLDVVRIEAGRPRAGFEIGPDTLPAELGLVERTVSFDKGCYTGQEIVARMHSRGRVGHRMVGLALAGDEPPARGAPIEANGKRVGEVTSAARSPRFGAIALAIVRVGADADDTDVRVAGRPARVVALPFAAAHAGS